MATYYWVGGTGNWDTTTTHWSTSSGGAAGSGPPTSADDVVFDSLSNATAYTVTITGGSTVCRSITVVGPLAGNVTFAGSAAWKVYGSFTLPSTGITWSYTGTITFASTSTGNTITTNGITLSGTPLNFNGVGGGWTLGSALTTTQNVVFTNGTFNTGNYNCSNNYWTNNGSGTTSLSLGSSTITVTGSGWNFANTTGLTFNAGTSTIISSSTGGASFAGGGLTYNTVNITGGGSSTFTITGANTFANLSFTANTVVAKEITISANQTVTGTISTTGGTYNQRLFFDSSTLGTAQTISAGTVSLSYCDFQDITGAGAGTWSGTSYGNCGGNSGITFTTAKTVYWNLSGSQNWSATGWCTSSGGTPAAANFPLAQDTAIIDQNSSITSLTIETIWNIGTIDMSTRTSSMTISTLTNNSNIYGNWLNGSGTTISGTVAIFFSGRNTTQTITSNSRSFSQGIYIQTIGGTVAINGNLTTSGTTLNNGTLDLTNGGAGNYTLSTGLFISSGTNTRQITFGTGNITCTGTGTVWNTVTTSGLTITGTPVVNVTSTGSTAITVSAGTYSGGIASFNFTGGTYALTLTGNYYFRSLDFTGYSGTLGSNTLYIYGNLTLSSTMTVATGAQTWTFNGTSGPYTITTNGISLDKNFTFNGIGGTWNLGSSLTLSPVSSSALITHVNGTINLASYTLTSASYTTSAGTKNLTFNGGTFVVTASTTTAFNNAAPTSFTTTAGTGTGSISMTGASAKTFVGGGSTYNCTLNQGGAGALTITGANTFNNISNSVQPATVTFPASTTNTFSNFNLNGTSGNLITINSSTSGTQATISKASGTVSVNYLSIKDSNATGGASWYAGANSTNVSNNTGWLFSNAPFLVSFIENINAADSYLAGLVFNLSILEDSNPADSYIAGLGFLFSQIENVTPADSYLALTNYNSSVTETFIPADTNAVGIGTALTENVTPADASSQITNYGVSISENSQPADAFVLRLGVTQTENIGVVDFSTFSWFVSFAENLNPTDAFSTSLGYSISIVEDSQPADVQSVLTKYGISLSENMTLGELFNFFYTVSLSEGLTSADSFANTVGVTVTENLTGADASTQALAYLITIQEQINAADSSAQLTNYLISISEKTIVADGNNIFGWIRINDSQTITWSAVNNTQSTTWVNINSNQS
jgi:hypothetical protein